MASQKLMPERISYTEEELLSPDDNLVLKDKRDRRFFFLMSGYLPLLGVCAFLFLYGPDVLNFRHTRFQRMNITEDVRGRFWTIAPYFAIFFFLMATMLFAKFYFESLHPLIKDLKKGKKTLIFYKPKKTEMAFFNRFYLSTPLYNNQQIEVSREDFYSIDETVLLCLEMGSDSNFILRLRNGEKKINFY